MLMRAIALEQNMKEKRSGATFKNPRRLKGLSNHR